MWRKDACAENEQEECFRWSTDSGDGRFLPELCPATDKIVAQVRDGDDHLKGAERR